MEGWLHHINTIHSLVAKQAFRLLGTILLLLLNFAAEALHIKGGWIYYTYLGPTGTNEHRYKVNLKVYRDCAPPNPGQNDTQINFTAYAGGTTFYRDFPAPLLRSYQLRKTSYSECINPKPEVCYVILEYEAEIVLPASPQGYTLSFQRCCRINGIVNVTQPSNTIGNTYSITIPGTAANAGNVVNSSPEFNLKDTVLVCYNSNITLDYSAWDPDGDSLDYYFVAAYTGADQGNPNPNRAAPPPYNPLSYSTGYRDDNPFGTNLQIDRKTGLISGRSPAALGEYVVAVAVDEYRAGVHIATTRKELHVNVANCSIAAAQLPPRTMSCESYTVRFENLSPSPAILSYYWDFGVPNRSDDTSRNAVPTFTYPDTGVYRAKIVVNKGTTCSDSSFTEVRVYPGFFPGFNYKGSCFASPFLFTDTSKARYGVINSWKWDFGNLQATNDTSLLRNPAYRYPGIGNYTVTMDVTSSKGCSAQIVKNVEVTDKPLLQLAFDDTLICSIDTLQLRAMGTGSFQWNASPTLIGGNTATPLVFPRTNSSYIVTLTDNTCVATDTVRVRVIDKVTVDAGPDTTICLTDAVAMRPVTDGLYFSWQPAGIFDAPSRKNAIATPHQPVHTLYLTASVGKCSNRDSLVLRTVPYPAVNAGNDTVICYGEVVQLRGTTDGSIYSWAPTAQVAAANQLATTARLNQTMTFTLTVRDVKGCPKAVSDQVLVTVRPRIIVEAGTDTSVVIGQRLQFNATANAPNFNWTPPLGLSNPAIANPYALYTTNNIGDGDGIVRYTVTATTAEGCQGTDFISVRVFKTAPTIFVPSAFTPNSDGLNDMVKPVLAGVQRLEFFRIYNRYGQLVFETRESGKGWDGRINGMLQASNAFVYQCQAIDYLGNSLFSKGTVVLIR